MTPEQILDDWHQRRAVRLAQYSTRHALRRLLARRLHEDRVMLLAQRRATRPRTVEHADEWTEAPPLRVSAL